MQEKTDLNLRVYGWLYLLREEFLGALTMVQAEVGTLLCSEENEGDIKCGKEIIPVKGVKPTDINSIAEAINKAYGKKYLVKAYNKKWVDGLCEPERIARTLEFIPV